VTKGTIYQDKWTTGWEVLGAKEQCTKDVGRASNENKQCQMYAMVRRMKRKNAKFMQWSAGGD